MMLTPAAASGRRNACSTPTRSNGNGPRSFNSAHPDSDRARSGTTDEAHTTDSSSAVRVTEKKPPVSAQSGIGSSGERRTIAYSPGTTENDGFDWFLSPAPLNRIPGGGRPARVRGGRG